MRRACIDIGSNTTRLLVAEHDGAGLRAIHEERAFTRIGAALAERGTIPVAKRDEVASVVSAQLSTARAHGADDIRGVATAAIRHARDGVEFAGELQARTGLGITILSDREEARLAFVGAAGMIEAECPEPLAVVDVGGGSSEVVVGRAPARIEWWASLPVGSGALAARHLAHDPPTAPELAAARAEVTAAADAVDWSGPAAAGAVAVGGSATSLCRVAGPQLTVDALTAALRVLAAEPAEAIAGRYAIDPARARLLPAGLLILQELGRRLDTDVAVGRGGIREGVLLEAGAR